MEVRIPVIDCGPVTQWWITGYGEGENMRVGLSTSYGEFYVLLASVTYGNIFGVLEEKLRVTKTVYACLHRALENDTHENYTFEEFMEDINKDSNGEIQDQVRNISI